MNQDRQDVPEPGHTFHPSAAAEGAFASGQQR